MTIQANDAWPSAFGVPLLEAVIRAVPEDFEVEEIDAFAASGSGEHLLLRIEKRGLETAEALRRVARWAGVAEAAVGHAGLKDRHALTRQRLSVWLPKRVAPDPELLEDGRLRVLEAAWHARKLPRGALAGNRFVLMLRDLRGDRAAIEARLSSIAARGVPNYFGPQRFGRDCGNIAQALAMFDGRPVRRAQRALLLSAARAQLFNQILAARVAADAWDRALDGDVWMLDGSHSLFGPEPVDMALRRRLSAFDIHPTAALWGRGGLRSAGAAQVLELAAVADLRSQRLRAGLECAGLTQQRRATRMPVRALDWQWPDARTLRLCFELPPGGYATVVLDALGYCRHPNRSERGGSASGTA